MFNFLKKKNNEVPDVGKEDEFEAERKKNAEKLRKDEEGVDEEEAVEEAVEEETEEPEEIKADKKTGKKVLEKQKIDSSDFEMERVRARLESLNEIIKASNERFSGISQQIGEIRAMALANEKSISKATIEAEKTVDIVKEVKPEQLRIDYQKLDTKILGVAERIEAKNQFEESIMNEVKDLRRKAGIFMGTEALLKLNEEVKKDLIDIQRVSNRVSMQAEKSEGIFVELKSGFAENQKTEEIVKNLDSSYSGLKKEIEKLKIDYSNIVNRNELGSFQKTMNNKLVVIENALSSLESIESENERLSQIIETTLAISKRNKEDIADIAMTIGDDRIDRVSDYENQISSILSIIDTLAGQISELKKKAGIDTGIKAKHDGNIIGKKGIVLKNLEVHPKIVKHLFPKKPEIPELIKNVSKPDKQLDKRIDDADKLVKN